MVQDNATLGQNRASDPTASTWLSANAGSGKTKVLTDRVARLLLRDVSPQNILCLTYTKAAASEMQNRLFRLLGDWAMKEDVALRKELLKLGENSTQDLNAARRLFARAIETPGGLKIQTIHSFCASLLRRFPLEAGVSPQFTEMDERAQLILRKEVIEDLASGPASSSLAELAIFYSGQDFYDLTKEITENRQHFVRKIAKSEIWSWFGLKEDFDEAVLIDTVFDNQDRKLLADLVPILAQGKASDQKAAHTLAGLTGKQMTVSHLKTLERLFLFGKKTKRPFGAKIGSFPTGGLRTGAAADSMAALERLMQRVEDNKNQRTSLYSAQKTRVLHNFAQPFLKMYEARKLNSGWLDFDDLIGKAGALLSDPGLAAWVLYRLDGGIDHILVDEAQDTSPAQWKVIEYLAQEFTSGKGARDGVERTVFVVGDPKQSIYSFQGAEPAAFSNMNTHFDERLSQVGKRLENRKLEYSFRSASTILQLADHALLNRPGLGTPFRHMAYFAEKPGRVDLWPAIEKAEYKEARDWTDTADAEIPLSHSFKLGEAVAKEIKRLTSEESIQGKNGDFTPVKPGDILILVRRRTGGIFDNIIRSCKELGLPIAGADRMRIGAELAVKDLTALLKFLTTPEDDLSLAATLKSPLFQLTESNLYALAQPRGKGTYLWAALRNQADQYPECVSTLIALRKNADFMRPYELLERVLTRHHGRRNLLARLGHEAEDGIDALLTQALAYENTETPSLTGFLEWLGAMEVTIKRQMDTASDQIRVMTIHGAKGLEAPIVILADTAKSRPRNAPDLVKIENGGLAWKPPADSMPQTLENATGLIAEAEEQELSRLLYVAATRAKNWLIVAAAGEVGVEQDSWYSILKKGLEDMGAASFSSPLGPGLRHETGNWTSPRQEPRPKQSEPIPTLPGWALSPVSPAVIFPAPMSPSDLGGEKVLASEDGGLQSADGKRKGRQMHHLLEILPNYPCNQWPEVARNLLASGEDAAPPEEANRLCKEVSLLLTKPDLKHIFTKSSLAEVDISAQLSALGGKRIHGIIDRLLVSPERVLVVDFKSNAIVPDTPQDIPTGILRQMGAYILALEQIFPGRPVECAILWTATASLMKIPPKLAIAALAPP